MGGRTVMFSQLDAYFDYSKAERDVNGLTALIDRSESRHLREQAEPKTRFEGWTPINRAQSRAQGA